MRYEQEMRGSNPWTALALLVAFVVSVFLAFSHSRSESSDSGKPGLQEGTFVPVHRDTTKRERSPVALAALDRLNENSPRRWSVSWSEVTGVPKTMAGTTEKKYAGKAAEAAAAFAEEYQELFFGFDDGQPIENYSLEPYRTTPDKAYTSIGLNEYYKGVKVYHAGAGIQVSPEGRIERASNRLIIVELDNVSPSISKNKAGEIIRNAAAPDSVRQEGPDLELCIYPSLPPRLAYFGFKVIRGTTIGFVVDAHTGDFISVRPLDVCDWPGVRRIAIPDSLKAKQAPPEEKIQPYQPIGPVFQLPADSTAEFDNREKPKNPRAPDAANKASEFLQKQAKPRAPPQVPRRRDSTGPQSDGWFSDVQFSLTGLDQDQDGYCQTANIDWEADTYDGDSTLVLVEVGGSVDEHGEYLLFESEPYYIVGAQQEPWMGGVISVPFKDEWSFSLYLLDVVSQCYLDQYPWDPDPELTDIPMESALEDIIYRILDGHVGRLADVDGDWFDRSDTLLWEVHVGGYHDTTLGLTSRIYARDELGTDMYIGETDTFYMEMGSYVWQGVILLSPGPHGLFDFSVELINPSGEISDWIPYDWDSDLTDVQMERINEDPRVTTVFDPNPVHQLKQYYLEDHNDSNFTLLYLAYREVELPDLMPDPWDYYLVGDYVEIFDSLPYFTEQAVSSDGVFPHYRCDDEFEEVMCYYHIDRSQRYIQSIGFLNACNRAIKVDAHAFKVEDEYGIHDTLGWYRPNLSGTGYICFGDGGIDWGEDGDIILHEYGHAVQDNQAPGIYGGNGDVGFGNETLIMCEGFAHYWACSMTDSASNANGINAGWIGEWVVKGADPYRDYLNTLDNNKLYPDHLTFDPEYKHDDAELWGGALWDIRETFGKRIADSIILRSHMLIYQDNIWDPVFKDGADVIIKADRQAYEGEHVYGLFNIFWDRGIVPSCDCDRWGDVDGNGVINPVDVVFMVNCVYLGNDIRVQHANCPREAGDVNCDGIINPVDVVFYVNKVYLGNDQFCPDPCP